MSVFKDRNGRGVFFAPERNSPVSRHSNRGDSRVREEASSRCGLAMKTPRPGSNLTAVLTTQPLSPTPRTTPQKQPGASLVHVPHPPKTSPPGSQRPHPTELHLDLGDLSALSPEELAPRKKQNPAKKPKKGKSKNEKKVKKGKKVTQDGPSASESVPGHSGSQTRKPLSPVIITTHSNEPDGENALDWYKKMKKRVTLL